MKVSEILYLSVCQIPTPIRAYLKILVDSLIKHYPHMSKLDIYRQLTDLLVDKYLA